MLFKKTLYKYNIANFVITLLNLYNKFTGILAVNEDIKLAPAWVRKELIAL